MARQVKDLLFILDAITNGRCIKTPADYTTGRNPFVLTRSSGIPGKAITEMPGLVWGDMDMEIKKVAVLMTMTESAIELAAATGVNAIVAHHPVADAANSGGTLIKTYLGTYKLALFELHEAFHGLHNGVPLIHGHKPFFSSIAFGGIQGNVVYVGEVLPEIKTVQDLKNRIDRLMNVQGDQEVLASERIIRNCPDIWETSISARCQVLAGRLENTIKLVIHMFPHAGFTVEHLENLMEKYPDVDTLLASSSRVYPGHRLLTKAEELGLNFVCGNSHAMEIYENGLPLAKAIKRHLPDLEVVIFRERMTSIPIEHFGAREIRDYGDYIVGAFLTP
jgi:hypothetical protein